MRVVGIVSEQGESPDPIDGIQNLGDISGLESIINDAKPDRLIIGLKERRDVFPTSMLLKNRLQGVPIEEADTPFQSLTGKVPVESIRPSSLIFSDGFSRSAFHHFYKRTLALVLRAHSIITRPI